MSPLDMPAEAVEAPEPRRGPPQARTAEEVAARFALQLHCIGRAQPGRARKTGGDRPLVRQLTQRHSSLEQLIDVVRLVMRHVLHLEVHVVALEFGVLPLAVPVGR